MRFSRNSDTRRVHFDKIVGIFAKYGEKMQAKFVGDDDLKFTTHMLFLSQK
jgi:hypothetical protein